MPERLRNAVPGLQKADECKSSRMQQCACRVQIGMQRHESTSITDCDRVAFAGSADRNAFADSRRNTEYDSIANTDGAHAHTITPVTLEPIRAETSSQDTRWLLFRSMLQLSNNFQVFARHMHHCYALGLPFTFLV